MENQLAGGPSASVVVKFRKGELLLKVTRCNVQLHLLQRVDSRQSSGGTGSRDGEMGSRVGGSTFFVCFDGLDGQF